MGILEIVGQILKLLNLILPEIFKLIQRANERAEAEAKRLADAMAAEAEAKALSAQRESLCSEQNLLAFKLAKETIWLDRYDMVLKHLAAKEYPAILLMVKPVSRPAANNILFYSDKEDIYRAHDIVELMKASTSS